MAKRPHCDLPTVVGRPDEIDVPRKTDVQIEAMLAITEHDKAINRDQQHAAWAYVLKIAETPLDVHDQEIADDIIRATYERLMSLSSTPPKYDYAMFSVMLGEAMMKRDGISLELGPRTPQKAEYFRSRLYPDGEPDFGQVPKKKKL